MKLLFEKSSPGRRGTTLPGLDVPKRGNILPKELLRDELNLPELSEVDVVRHYIQLSRVNFGVDNGFYPLGSCTMKYNPKINEDISRFDGFASLHPYSPAVNSQGSLRIIYELERYLSEIIGMDKFTLQPAAGAHGELTGVIIMKAYFDDLGERRDKILIPDSAHGTNPASSVIAGFETVEIKTDEKGGVDVENLKEVLDDDVAGLMLTNPNTLGLFDENILKIADLLHKNGSLFYCDGANVNAVLGISKPGDMGFDIIQLNLHKTFSTPHGGGGPGSGPVGVKKHLVDFLPKPLVVKEGDSYKLDYDSPKSIGRVKAFYGNFGVMVKAYTYIRALGSEGLRGVAENSVLNANYLMAKLKTHYDLPYKRTCMHEFVLSDRKMPNNVMTNDIAKRLLDYGFHAPTVYFPLNVKGAIMIEPTETESKETLDEFAEAMIKIKKEAKDAPDLVKNAPHSLVVTRLDAVKAAREPKLRWEPAAQ